MQRRGPLCQLRIENEVYESLLELEKRVGHAQLLDAQGLLGAIPSDEMPEEDPQIRRCCPRNAHAGKDVVRVDGVDKVLQKPAVTGLVEVEQLHFTGGIEKILRIDVVVNEAIMPRLPRHVPQPGDMALEAVKYPVGDDSPVVAEVPKLGLLIPGVALHSCSRLEHCRDAMDASKGSSQGHKQLGGPLPRIAWGHRTAGKLCETHDVQGPA